MIRANHSKLLDTLDRETLTLLAASLTTALLGAGKFSVTLGGAPPNHLFAEAITPVQFLTGLGHLRRVAKATYNANDALSAEAKKSPKNDPDPSQLGNLIEAATAALKKIR